jgi:hypothetical protein
VKKFYSTEDIEALAARGVTELVVDQDTVLTHLARDMAHKLGITVHYGAPAAAKGPRSGTAPRPQPTGPSLRPGMPRSEGPGAKPKGCQHGPQRATHASPLHDATGSTDQAVRELVDLVKGLSKGDGT